MTKMEAEVPATPQRETRPRTVAFYVGLAAALYAVVHIYSLLAPILLSFLLIILITLAVNPIISRMRQGTGGRKRAAGLILFGVLTFGALAAWATVVPLKNSVSTLSEKLPGYWERLQKPLIKMEQKAVLSEEKLQKEVSAEIAEESPEPGGSVEPPPSQPAAAELPPPEPIQSAENSTKAGNGEGPLRSGLISLIRGVFDQFKGVALNTTQIIIVLVTTFFGVIFTLMNPRPIFGAIFSLLPERHHKQALAILQRIGIFVPRWAGATLIGMFSIGFLVFLLMWPILGFTDALVLGLVAGILEAVPFIGPILSAVPAILLALVKGGMTPLWVVIAYVAVQAMESYLIMPMIMARGMKLHPLAVLFSMLLCVLAFGVLGVLVAAPLVAIVGILHDELYRKHIIPTTTRADVDRLSRMALREKVSELS